MEEIKTDEVLVKSKKHGQTVLAIEMLLEPTSKITLTYDEDTEIDYITMVISNTELDTTELTGTITLDNLKDYITALKIMYKQLNNKISE